MDPGPWSQSPPKFNHLFIGPLPTLPEKFHANPFGFFCTKLLTDRQTITKISRLVFTARLRPQVWMPPVHGSVVRIRRMVRTQHFWIRTSLSSTAAALHATIHGRLPEWHTSKCISSVSFVRIQSNFFTIPRRCRCKKMMDQNFEIRILWFLRIFFKIFNKASRSGPLWSWPN